MRSAVLRNPDAAFDAARGEGPGRRWRGPPSSGGEPAFRAPWPVLAIVVAILGGYGLQSLAGDQQGVEAALGFRAADLAAGRLSGLVTALFVHGGWTHAGLNAVAALAFGVPVARLFGVTRWRPLVFFGFYLACGVVGSLGFAVLHRGSAEVLVGASGAVSGLMGAASRLIERPGRLAPFSSPTVIGMAGSWIATNLLLAVFGLGVAVAGAPIAWEAHLFGYAAGLLAVGPVARLVGRA